MRQGSPSWRTPRPSTVTTPCSSGWRLCWPLPRRVITSLGPSQLPSPLVLTDHVQGSLHWEASLVPIMSCSSPAQSSRGPGSGYSRRDEGCERASPGCSLLDTQVRWGRKPQSAKHVQGIPSWLHTTGYNTFKAKLGAPPPISLCQFVNQGITLKSASSPTSTPLTSANSSH